jgi:peptidylprolyl isomerase
MIAQHYPSSLLKTLQFLGLIVTLFCAMVTPSIATVQKKPNSEPQFTNTASGKINPAMDLENTLYLDIPFGRVVIALRPDLAPKHVARIKELARQNFYDNVPFHRVIEGFMAQTGDPTGTGTGGSGKKLAAEFSPEPHFRGTVSMARAGDPNSADSQFFICLADTPHLNGQYTVWGKVISGMEAIDQVRKGDSYTNGIVSEPTRISTLRVAADVERQAAAAAGR